MAELNKSDRGVSVIEILIVIFLVIIGLTSLLGFTTFSLNISNLTKQTIQANNLAQEAMEAVRNFRDGTDWSVDGLGVLVVDTAYYFQETNDNPPKVQLVTGEDEIGGFTREIVFSRVFRNPVNDNIADSGDEDLKTRKVTITVSWKDKEVKLATYLTDWQ